jgi:rare lipoprotein A
MSAQGGTARRHGRSADLAMLVALGFVLSACASSGPETGGGRHGAGYHRGQPSYKVGAAYQINGKWYRPRVDYCYDETGLASWYGEAFDGKATANGEIFNLNELSAAHKTLPLPSVVEVSNMRNGRSLRLRVNDRGPYVDSRIIDVSRRAAQLLGFEMAGTTPVRVRILKDESIEVAEAAMRGQAGRVQLAAVPRSSPVMAAAPIAAAPPPVIAGPPRREPPPPEPAPIMMAAASPPPPEPAAAARRQWPSLIAQAHADTLRPAVAASPMPAAIPVSASGRIFVQAGAFAIPENAQRVRARIAALGNVQVVPAEVNGAALYRVRLGPVTNGAEADRLLNKVVGSGYPTARIVSE